jgi:hypothetical protein
MIETAVLAIFITAMLTLAAGLWNLKGLAATRYMPQPGRSGDDERN